MKSSKILSINLRYYRKVFNMSQEKFAELIESTLVYVNQLEQEKRNPSIGLLDKIALAITKELKKINKNSSIVTGADLITYNPSHVTSYKRIDGK